MSGEDGGAAMVRGVFVDAVVALAVGGGDGNRTMLDGQGLCCLYCTVCELAKNGLQ